MSDSPLHTYSAWPRYFVTKAFRFLDSVFETGDINITRASGSEASMLSAHVKTSFAFSTLPRNGATTKVGVRVTLIVPIIICGSRRGFLRDGIFGPSICCHFVLNLRISPGFTDRSTVSGVFSIETGIDCHPLVELCCPPPPWTGTIGAICPVGTAPLKLSSKSGVILPPDAIPSI